MESKNRPKMPVSQRAKQFMPFAAVTGLDEAIRRVEIEFEMSERREKNNGVPGDNSSSGDSGIL